MQRRLVVLVGALLLAVSAADAQDPSVPPILAGRWRYPHDEAHGNAIAQAAIEPVISALPPMIQPIARERVQERARIAQRIEITLAEQVSVVYASARGRFEVATVLGRRSPSRDLQGREIHVTQRITAGWLEQVFEGPNGIMRQLMSTEPDGATMHLDVTLENDRLGAPIRWRLDYAREP